VRGRAGALRTFSLAGWGRAAVAALALAVAVGAPVARAAFPPPVWVGGKGGVYYRNLVVVLTWHDVEPHGHYDTISASQFAAQMAALQADGFHPIPPSRLAPFLAGRASVPPNAVLLTFDNGTEGVYRYAFPVLRRYRFPFLLFPIFGRTGVDPGFLTSAQIRALVASGLCTLGSHTYQEHNGLPSGPGTSGPADVVRRWTGKGWETWSQYDARVLADARRAQAAIRRYMGRPEPYFSDPFGQYTPRLLALLRQAGFTEDFTTLGWGVVAGAPADRLPRINVGTGSSTASSMVGSILYVAHLTAEDPSWHPPQSYVRLWG
jgi:biofilm PGA synthesis lipoprotein PgaB